MPASRIITIERHILEQQEQHPDATGTLTQLLYDIALAAKIIARETTRAGLADIIGATAGHNIFEERQQKLDIFADQTIYNMTRFTGRLCAMASEEQEGLIEIPPQFSTGKYVLLFDPLAGSSNIDVNVSIGTIFSIFQRVSEGAAGTMTDLLQPGHRLVAAGYVIYGSSTMMVYSTGNGVHGFTLETSVGEFLLSHPNIRIPEKKPVYYSVNQGYERFWPQGIQNYIRWLQGMYSDSPAALSLRYIGSLVADFHRNLLRGGVFAYPGDLRDPKKPFGKLRLMLEGQPLAFIAGQAGGYASDGIGDILAIQPHSIHQQTPLFIGNRDLVEKAEQFIQEYDQDWVEKYLPFRQKKYTPENRPPKP